MEVHGQISVSYTHLDVYKRQGYELTQSNPYYTDEDLERRKKDNTYEEYELEQETFTAEEEKQYKIVGIMERLDIENYSAPGYTMITKLENTNINKDRNVALLLKKPSETYNFSEYLKRTLNINEATIQVNEGLLYYMGIFKSNRMENFLLVMAMIVIGIILFTSASVSYTHLDVYKRQRLNISNIGSSKKSWILCCLLKIL